MNQTFHVQGRLIERRGSTVIRDETCRVDADSRDEAIRIAAVLRGDGFTVWVWAVDPRPIPAVWDLDERIEPLRRAASGTTRDSQDAWRGTADRSRRRPA